MRILFPVLLVIVFSFSCNSPARKETPLTDSSQVYKADTLEGAYIGDFGGSDIRIVLTHVTGIHAVGYDLHKGLRRNISGIMKQAGSSFLFTLNEPGDHKFDGRFEFSIDTLSFTLTGTWTPLNDKSLTAKTFTLKRMPDTGMYEYELFNTWSDSIGQFHFLKSGFCMYEFYPIVDGKPAEQLIRVKGSWTFRDSAYTVDWEQNAVFPSRRSVFLKRQEHIVDTAGKFDYYRETLLGENRTLEMNEF